MDKRYQVFVSSTYADLKEERSAVIQTLMKMDCIPAGMELFPAIDEEQFLFIKRVIDDCDYYVLIIGGRYGSTTAEGLSYTEKEFDYALERGLKVVAFVHDDPLSIPLGKSETDPQLRDRLALFRQKVSSERLVNFWSNAKELPGLVAVSLLQAIKLYPAIGWVRADQVASSDVLNDLNELRKSNQVLAEQNKTLQQHLADAMPKVEGVAGMNENVVVTGTRKQDRYSASTWNITVTWNELFAEVAPQVLGHPSDTVMHTYFNASVKNLYKRKANRPGDYHSWDLDDSVYQSAKVQFIALGLIDVSMQGTVNGGMALFWSLTALGRETMLALRTAKTRGGPEQDQS